jgi:dTDP-glucose 4,6-dehydratase
MRPYDGRAVPTFIRQALRAEPITVAGDGSQTRSMQYVDDLVEGIWCLLHSTYVGPINIGNRRTEVVPCASAVGVPDVQLKWSDHRFEGDPVDMAYRRCDHPSGSSENDQGRISISLNSTW